MEYKTTQIFGLPIIKFEREYLLNNNELNFISNTEYEKSNPDNSAYISTNKNILTEDNLSNLKQKFFDCARKYIEDIICVNNQFDMTHSWAAKSNKEHHQHNHKNSIINVVYYAQAESAQLKFTRLKNLITEAYDFDLDYQSFNLYNAFETAINIKSGDFVLFPGHLVHTGYNLSNKEKITIAANFFIKGQVGFENNVSGLVI